ncbi:MAG: alpha-ketoacid dehydrogenase subunit beta [Deltaproteobacteria bacterium]
MPILTYLQAVNLALKEEMRRDADVFVLGEDVAVLGGAFKATDGILEEFGPSRILDTPISEALIVGAGVGAAALGLRPVVEMQFMDFIACGFDQVVNMAATARYRHGGTMSVPLVIRGPCGGGVHGALFHSQDPEAWFTRVPGLKVVAPATARDARGLLKAAIRDDDPVIFLEHKRLYRSVKEELPDEQAPEPLGVARVVREGSGATIVTYGGTLPLCLAAAERLTGEGFDLEVIDLRTLLPLDFGAIARSVGKTGKLLAVHEDRRTGGLGGEILARVVEELWDELDAPPRRVTAKDCHTPFASTLEAFVLPSEDDITEAARQLAAY